MPKEEEELLACVMTLMEYCKSKKQCKGCIFWKYDTACCFRYAPRRWQVYGFGKWFEKWRESKGD